MTGRLRVWSPRILGILVCFFLSLFSLDAFGSGKTFFEAVPDFAIHIAPVLILLVVLAVSWRREWVGGLVFTGLATVYAYDARSYPSWIVVISGPMLIVGMLFFWSWIDRREVRVDAGRSAV
jgi:hypothetical protein